MTFNIRFWKKGMYSLLVHSKLEEEAHESEPTFEKLQPSINGCLFQVCRQPTRVWSCACGGRVQVCLCLQYKPQADELSKPPSYPLGENVMGELGLSAWGRKLLDFSEATRQNAVLKLQNGEWP